jgi:outer membrane protein TolC
VETTRYVAARAPNRARQSEVDDARASELGARIAYINSFASYLSQVDAFKITLGLPISQQLYLDDSDLAALGQVGLIPAAVDQEHAFGLAVENHADILNAIDQFEDRKRKVRIAADKLKTQVTLIGSASYRADEEEDYRNFDPDKFNYGVGLQIDLPFNRLPERNAYRTTLVQFEQELRSLGLTLDDFKNRIDRGLRTLEQRRLNFVNRVAQLDVNRRRVEQNQLLLEAGRVQIREVRESQDLLIQAQNELIFTRVQYQEARLQLLVDMGVMQTDAPEFWLADPLAGMIEEEEQRGVNPLKMPEDELVPPDEFLEARHDAN